MAAPSVELLAQAADEVLTFIEQREADTIAYGIYDVAIRGKDVLDGCHPSADLRENLDAHLWPDVLRATLQSLSNTLQIVRFDDENDPAQFIFRSRIAETIRLVNQVRQRIARFPGQQRLRLATSPRLIDDLRYSVYERRVPRRNIPAADVLDRLTVGVPPSTASLRLQAADILGTVITRRLPKLRVMSGFQQRAFGAIIDIVERDTGQRAEKGVVVTAGTGAGKTYAFFLPVLAKMLLDRALRARVGVKAICIYPRVALSENQLGDFIEILYHLNAELGQRGLPALTVGIESGAAVYRASDFASSDARHRERLASRGWVYDEDQQGYRCPFAFAVTGTAGQPDRLIVRPQRPDVLVCPTTGEEYPFILFARDRMAQCPPDLLIATTESLNRRLTESAYQHLFGDARVPAPSIVMLDEVHLQTSTSGSQVALLLRRLRARLRVSRQERDESQNVAFVGLSATIAQPLAFMSELSGINPTQIAHVRPEDEEMQVMGAERFVFARAAESEDTANLSTLIQTAMAVLHTMPQPAAESGLPRYRAFGFVQSLDLVSRWTYQMQDAERTRPTQRERRERYESEGRPYSRWPIRDVPLFAYRQPPYNHEMFPGLVGEPVHCRCETQRRPDPACPLFRAGECWWVLSQAGAALAAPLAIKRKSGNDRQVAIDQGDDLIVTTSALEVGYDDDALMCVLQYQAPADVASFVQRKGRGGRKVRTRPIVVTVLSPYKATDLFLFRNSHLLTEPTFHKLPLNAGNHFLQRIHGIYALFDWLAYRAAKDGVELGLGALDADGLRYIMSTLDSPESLAAARAYIGGVLQMSDGDALTRLLIDSDDGILHVCCDILLPGVCERLARGDGDFTMQGRLAVRTRDLLRAYLPENLFSNINLPEVRVNFAPSQPSGGYKSESISLALSETIPGNVTFRGGAEATWIPPLSSGGPLDRLPLTPFYIERDRMDETVSVSNLPERALVHLGINRQRQRRLEVYRPTTIAPVNFGYALSPSSWIGDPTTGAIRQFDDDIPLPQGWARLLPTSSGYPIGASSITVDRPPGRRYRLDATSGAVTGHTLARQLVQQIDLHSDERYNQSPLSVTRLMLGSQYAVKFEGNADTHEGVVGFCLDEGDARNCALGYTMTTEGIRFDIRPDVLAEIDLPASVSGRLRFNFTRHAFIVATTTEDGTNFFTAQHAANILMLVADSQESLPPGDLPTWFVAGDDAFLRWTNQAITQAYALSPKNTEAVRALLALPGVIDRFRSIYADMATGGPLFTRYLRDCFWLSLTAAFKGAAQDVAGVEALNYIAAWTELEADYPERSRGDIWLYEIGEGGIGVMRAAQRTLQEEPDRYWALVDRHATRCETARDEAFLRYLLAQDEDWLVMIATLVERVRDPQGADLRWGHIQSLLAALRARLGTPVRETHVKAALRVFTPEYDLDESEARLANWRLYREINAVFLPKAERLLGRLPAIAEARALLVASVKRAPMRYPTCARLLEQYREMAANSGDADAQLGRAIERRVLLTCYDGCPACLNDRSGEIESPALAAMLLSRSLMACWVEAVRVDAVVRVDETRAGADVSDAIAAVFNEGWDAVRVRVPSGHLDALTRVISYLNDAGIETRVGLFFPRVTEIVTVYGDDIVGAPVIEATIRLALPEGA